MTGEHGLEALPGPTLADEEVIARVRRGETELFELLMRRYNQRVYRAVRAILRDGPDLEDILQQVWLSAYLHLDRFEGRSRFSTWLHRIAQNAALDRTRRPVRLVAVGASPEAGDPVGAPAADPERSLLAREQARAIERALDALPESHRRVFVLREVEGLSTAEVAEALGVGEGAVKTRLYRARADLRERLGRDVGDATSLAFRFGGSRCDALVRRVMVQLPGLESGSNGQTDA